MNSYIVGLNMDMGYDALNIKTKISLSALVKYIKKNFSRID